MSDKNIEAVCPKCGAPCTTKVEMRGGDHGWGTTDAERTTYRYATEAAAMAATVPAGWVLVPLEPTAEMKKAGRLAIKFNADSSTAGQATVAYQDMLAAAPLAPVAGQPLTGADDGMPRM